MKKAGAIGNSRQLSRINKEMGIKDTAFSETISEGDGTIAHFQSKELDRWTKHFREQFNWTSATLPLPIISSNS